MDVGPVLGHHRGAVERHGVLARQAAGGREVGDDAEAFEAGALPDHLDGAGEQRRIAPELVDDVTLRQRAFGRAHERVGADEVRNDAAARDVAHQDHGRLGRQGEAHVGDVAFAQVHFRRASGPFDQYQFRFGPQDREAFQNRRHEARLKRVVVAGVGVPSDPSLDDHLRSHVRGGLEQHRIHVDAGGDARGLRLEGLGAADLAGAAGTVVGNGGVDFHNFPADRRVDIAGGLHRFNDGNFVLCTELAANVRKFNVHKFSHFVLSIVGNTNGDDVVTVQANPFMRFGVLQFLGDVHGIPFDKPILDWSAAFRQIEM